MLEQYDRDIVFSKIWRREKNLALWTNPTVGTFLLTPQLTLAAVSLWQAARPHYTADESRNRQCWAAITLPRMQG